MTERVRPKPFLVLNGIDGGNPLGFLAALGTALVAGCFCEGVRLHWCVDSGHWRPSLTGVDGDEARFIADLLDTLRSVSMRAFEIDDKLPFSVESLRTNLEEVRATVGPDDRRTADFLAAFGSEVGSDKDVFQDSRFRMVRSGDSAGQGLPAYARDIRNKTDAKALHSTLFSQWHYKDEGFSLRWDPVEDQRYALRWRDPSKSGTKDGPGTMIGANSLAIEALQWYPTALQGNRVATTGFHRNANGETWFTWPIWDRPISLDVIRSLVALPDLHVTNPPRAQLARRGIVEIYRSQRIQQNQYYSNFTSARPA